MLAVGLILMFICGLPISFGIGAIIGYIVWKIQQTENNTKKRNKSMVIGGITYIISQPISIFISYLPIRKLENYLGYNIPIEGFSFFEMIFAVLFAIIFTICISIIGIKLMINKH